MSKKNTVHRILVLGLVVFMILIAPACNDSDDGTISTQTTPTTPTTQTDSSAPEVTSVSPVDGTENVDLDVTIGVTFDEAMDTASITVNSSDKTCSGAIQVSANSFSSCVVLSATVTASNDDKTFTLTPVSGLGLSGAYQTRVTTLAKDVAGNTLTETYTATTGFSTPDISSWAFVDGNEPEAGLNRDSDQQAQLPQLTVVNSKLYASWKEVGSNGNAQIRVAVYNGDDSSSDWNFVDGGGSDGIIHNAGFVADDGNPHDTIAFNSKLYAAWSEKDISAINQIRVAVYNGNDSSPGWNFVDGDGSVGLNQDPSHDAKTPDMEVVNSKLYITWSEKNNTNFNQVRVAVYNGDDSNPSWTWVDGVEPDSAGINYATDMNAYKPRLTGFNSKLYAIWFEDNPVAQIRVAVYNGDDSAPAWRFVEGVDPSSDGINFNTSQAGDSPQLTAFNGKLYATWQEDKGGYVYQMRVAVYNGNDDSPSWSFVDGYTVDGINFDPSLKAVVPQLTVLNSKLYATWHETATVFQVRIAHYNGNDANPGWTFVEKSIPDADGVNKDTAKRAANPQLTEFNSKLYAVWNEYKASTNVYQIRVAVGQ